MLTTFHLKICFIYDDIAFASLSEGLSAFFYEINLIERATLCVIFKSMQSSNDLLFHSLLESKKIK